MTNADYVAGLPFVGEGDRDACLGAMEQYGEHHWWEEGADLREAAYYQLREPVLILSGRRFEAALLALLGRPVLSPEVELSPSNVAVLLQDGEAARTQGTPAWSRQALQTRLQEIMTGAMRDGSIPEIPQSIIAEQIGELLDRFSDRDAQAGGVPVPRYRIDLPGGRSRTVETAEALWRAVNEIALWYLRRAVRAQGAGALEEDDELRRRIGASVFGHLVPRTVQEYAALIQLDEGIWEAFYPQSDEDEQEEPTPRHVFDTTLRESIIDHLYNAESFPHPSQFSIQRYPEELVVFTEEEALAIVEASDEDPWTDMDESLAPGNGFVFPVKYLDALEGLVIPAGITGSRRWGLWIDGYLPADVLASFQEVLGQRRLWRAWSACDFALVLPDEGYEAPMDDPVLQQLEEAVPLEEAFHSLADLQLTFVELEQGYLVARNAQGQFEAWWRLPDDGQVIGDPLVKLEYEGDLYSRCDTRETLGEIRQLIEHELGK
jgi:hypothetical protein